MQARLLILTMLLFLAAVPLRAQWSGSVDFSAGLGGMKGDKETGLGYLGHLLAQGDFGLRYQTETFTWTTAVKGKWEPKSSDNSRLNFSSVRQDGLDLDLVYKTVKVRPMELGVRSDFAWKPSKGRSYSAWVSYTYTNDRGRNVSNNLSGTIKLEDQQVASYLEHPQELVKDLRLDAMESHLASCYYETPRLDEHNMAVGAAGGWLLGERSLLEGAFSLSTTSSRKHTTWSVFKTSGGVPDEIDINAAFDDGNAWMYRITPVSIDFDFAADIHLRRTIRDDEVRLHWMPGLRFSGNHSLDNNSGASLADIGADGSYVWRDSLRLRENFDFLAINADPFVAAEYRGKDIEILADYSAQFYFNRLNDDTHNQPLGLRSVSPVGHAILTWKISDMHKLGITHEVGVEYPDFYQMCWYDRSGGYADQLFRGNADLVASLHSSYGISYTLKYKRLLYRATNSVTRKIDEIDQTWTNEEIEGRLYKVFHWVNSADSWSFGTTHRLDWQGKRVRTGAGVGYNQSRRTSKTDGTVKDSSDWLLAADAEADLGKGFLAGANVKYQSEVSTFFSSFNGYWELNAHIQKVFKGFTLRLDGRDLLDEARLATFESADGGQLWVDVARENRRLFLLTIKRNF